MGESALSTVTFFSLKFILFLLCFQKSKSTTEFESKLETAVNVTDRILHGIWDKWKIDKYPNFLQTAAMTHTSWEVLKLKFQQRILKAHSASYQQQKFVISFTGSSVTAGHDSPFNATFPILTEKLMAPAFDVMNISLIGRNAAMGNNPWYSI